MSTTLEQKLNLILNEKETKILPENIKKDVQIFDIVGTLENSGIDTSDATAKASDIISTKTAYVNGEKITGTLNNNGSMTYNAGDNVVNIDNGVHTKSKINPVDITTLAKYHNYYNTNVHILRDMSIPYTKIEYLQSTGKQLIDTGIQIRKNITFEICTQLTNPNNDEYMFGGGDGWVRNCIAPRNIDTGGFNMYPYIGTDNYDCYNQSNIAGKHTYRYEKGLFKSDGVTRINRTSIADFTSKNNFGIFGATAFGRGRIKFYYCKIWDEDMNLVRDFIPVKDSSGVGCLYDFVTERFYYDTINQERFIVGADILDMSVDDQLEIISSERDNKILPENIKKDVTILGVTGELESSEINNQDKTITENGTYTADEGYTGLGTVTVNVPTTGSSATDKAINFYDYDGTLLYGYTLDEIQELTELPDTPVHEGLVTEGWNWTLDELKAVTDFADVGCCYVTDTGATRIYVTNTPNTLSPEYCFYLSSRANATIDWGDGNTDTVTATSAGRYRCGHTYTEPGDYVISILFSNPDTSYITLDGNTGMDHYSYVYRHTSTPTDEGTTTASLIPYAMCVTKVEFGTNNGMTLPKMQGCKLLKSVTVPLNSSTDNYTYSSCVSLNSVVMGRGFYSTCEGVFNGCINIEHICSSGTFRIQNNMYEWQYVSGCKRIKRFRLPEGMNKLRSIISSDEFTDIHFPSTMKELEVFMTNSQMTHWELPSQITRLSGNANAFATNCNKLESVSILGTFEEGYTKLGNISDCPILKQIELSDSITELNNLGNNCASLRKIVLPASTQTIKECFQRMPLLEEVDCTKCTQVPACTNNSFKYTNTNYKVYVPALLYNDWVSASGWSDIAEHIVSDYTATECTGLSITADDTIGNNTTTTIHVTAVTNGIDRYGDNVENVTITFDDISEEFEQNTTSETIEKTVTYTYFGQTATATFNHTAWIEQSIVVNLNNEWRVATTLTNPDNAKYNMYESNSNYNVGSGVSTMNMVIKGYTGLQILAYSSSEPNYDYLIIGIDSVPTESEYAYKINGKSSTPSGISDYTTINLSIPDLEEHTIYFVYRKDGSGDTGNDRSYVLVPNDNIK